MAMRRLIRDIETDGLEPTKIWCEVAIDVDTEEVFVWRYDRPTLGSIPAADLWIGHNFLDFDGPVINHLSNQPRVDYSRCIDTLVCSRLFNQQIVGGHSLDAWGERLGEHKASFSEWYAYDVPEQEQDRIDRCVQYCIQDCRVNLKLFKYLEKWIYSEQWRQSLRCEHDIAIICRELHDNGFYFDYEKARSIYDDLTRIVQLLSTSLGQAFKPRSKLVRSITPKLTKHGTLSKSDFRFLQGDADLSGYGAGNEFCTFEYVPFNPGSPKQVIERLNEAGWKPFEKTKGYKECEKELRNLDRSGNIRRNKREFDEKIKTLRERLASYEIYGWTISEENLETLPEDAPEGCRLFVKWRMLSKRLQTLEEWFDAYKPITHRIHGSFAGIGAWTHRMAHSGPNMGNTPSVDSKYHAKELKDLARRYGSDMRGCWTVPSGYRLVGVDAEGIQLRVLAHYMNDPEFIEALVNGVKNDKQPELSTDVHTLNAWKLGYIDWHEGRPRAKTWIYAWLLGAGVAKSAKILGCSTSESQQKIQSFITGYPGLKLLKNDRIPSDASRGYFEGFDGRLIKSDEYHMLAGYLQAGEQAIMKHACIKWNKDLRSDGIDYMLVNFVHDEWQTQVPDDVLIAKHVIKVQSQSIVWAGEQFGLNCPMAGSGKMGYNWMETH